MYFPWSHLQPVSGQARNFFLTQCRIISCIICWVKESKPFRKVLLSLLSLSELSVGFYLWKTVSSNSIIIMLERRTIVHFVVTLEGEWERATEELLMVSSALIKLSNNLCYDWMINLGSIPASSYIEFIGLLNLRL